MKDSHRNSLLLIALTAAGASVFLWGMNVDTPTKLLSTVEKGAAHSSDLSIDDIIADAIPSDVSDALSKDSTTQVAWRESESRKMVRRPYGQKYEELKDDALEGDLDSALALHFILEECKPVFDQLSSMEESIETFRQTHTIQLPSWEKPLRMRNSEMLEVFIDKTRREFDDCQPITAAQKAESNMWLRKASQGGVPTAMLAVATQTDNIEESILLAELAWEAGLVEGLSLVAKNRLKKYERGESPTGNIDSFAAQYAYTILVTKSLEGHNDIAGSRIEYLQSGLRIAASGLHEHERLQAIDQAREMIVNNANCCFSM